jgi:23S rRNA pseudouridine2605 synthase
MTDATETDPEIETGPEAELPDSMPLQKWLIATGVGPKAQVRAWITTGEVRVDGEVIRRFAHPVAPEQEITVEGQPVRQRAPRVCLLMNKPIKHITGLTDPKGRATLGQYLPEGLPHVFPVGRLDYNTEGALLWTNDGHLARRILHPSYHLEKVYRVKIRGHLDAQDPGLARMRQGIDLGDFTTRPAQVELELYRTRATWVRITLTEGKFRQIRRMCRACNYQIVKLRRVSIGPVHLGELNPRCVRPLLPQEERELYQSVRLEAL